jgi:nucleoid DNA-binding protein
MRKKKEKLFVEGYEDHESAVNKIAADLNLDPVRVDATIRSFFLRVARTLRSLQNVYLLSFGLFNKTPKGRGQLMIQKMIIKKENAKNHKRYYKKYKRKPASKLEELDPWELNELDAQRHPEKWKDRIEAK